MYLIDANIFLELLLNQEKSSDCEKFLKSQFIENLFISEIALYSIGIILERKKRSYQFNVFLEGVVLDKISVLKLSAKDLLLIKETSEKFNLDFEDSYQYLVAKNHNLQLVSFDKDFDKTDLKRMEP
ncbi:MAG: PIN domain-containing protein [Candidatus Caenarcaniphilales bacterium]|nr:PIN domain-containing protein [Candidatus Caenarcaniphilales bacterium]